MGDSATCGTCDNRDGKTAFCRVWDVAYPAGTAACVRYERGTDAGERGTDGRTDAGERGTDGRTDAGERGTDGRTDAGERGTDGRTDAGERGTDGRTDAGERGTDGRTDAGERGTDAPAPVQEVVESPGWYTAGGIETIDKIDAIVDGLPARDAYMLGQIVRYADRAGYKDDPAVDLGKANNYAHRLVYGRWRDRG